jgi:hypothetical protein
MTPQEKKRINNLSSLQGKAQNLLNEWANYMAENTTLSEEQKQLLFDKWNDINNLVQEIGEELEKLSGQKNK